MPLLAFVFALFIPRVVILFLWFASHWFEGVFNTIAWPILGFIFAPTTLLWYSVVAQVYGGQWDTLQVIVLIVAVLIDLSPSRKKKRKKRSDD